LAIGLVGQRQLRRRIGMTLRCKQLALAIESSCIAPKRSVAADHPVTRDQDSHMIVPVRRSDRANRLGLTDRGGDLRIAPRLADRDLAQLAPDRLLER